MLDLKFELNINNAQFGFGGGLGTQETLFTIKALIQNCQDVRNNIFLCFVDYKKAFDRVKHKKLINSLKKIHVERYVEE